MKMSFADKIKFTEPLIDMEKTGVSLSQLSKHRKEIVVKLCETGEPLIVRINNQRLLLCDSKGYEELERKRHTLFQQFMDLEEALKTVTFSAEFHAPDWRELEDLKLKEAESKRRLKDLTWEGREETKNLCSIQERIEVIEASLKAKEKKPGTLGSHLNI